MIWRDGELIEDNTLLVDPSDRGLLLGDGLIETMKVANGRALFLTKHLARLQVSGQSLGFQINRHTLRNGVHELLQAKCATQGSLRVTVTRGPAPRGLSPVPTAEQRPMTLIAFHPAGPATPPQEVPDRLIAAPFVRSSGAVTARYKTLSYADNLAAMAYVKDERAADCLFFNERGEATSTTMANIFIRTGIGYLTPPLSAGILPGIVRDILLEEAAAFDVPIEIRPLMVEDLRDRLLFRTNSLIGVRPAWFDDRTTSLRPGVDEDDGLLESLYRRAERREEGV